MKKRGEREVGAETCSSRRLFLGAKRAATFETFTMPRVVDDQKEKFENDELFRKLRRESEVGSCGAVTRKIRIAKENMQI